VAFLPAFLSLSLVTSVPADSGRFYRVSLAKAESLWVTDVGHGEPVVLIPGLFGSAFGFRRVIPLLVAQGFRAIVIEPLGIGFSARPERANYSLTAQAERLAEVMERLDVGNAVVIGHAVGAGVAFRLAYRRPDLVRAIVSVEGGPAESVMTPGARSAVRFVPWVKWLGGTKVIRNRIHKLLIESAGDTAWITSAVVDGYTAGPAKNLDQSLKSLLTMASAKEPEKIKPHLAEIQAPVLLLVGGASQEGAPASEIEIMRKALGSFAVDTIPGSGLYVQEEAPEAVVEGVLKVLSRLPAVSRR
jgi:pimeloyl-ACP methyl ester carboxylesterase